MWQEEGEVEKDLTVLCHSGLLAFVCLLQGFFLTLHQGCVLT